jgi:hypothetical protein
MTRRGRRTPVTGAPETVGWRLRTSDRGMRVGVAIGSLLGTAVYLVHTLLVGDEDR